MLSNLLPKPKNQATIDTVIEKIEENVDYMSHESTSKVPAYGQRQNFIPKDLESFGDGGSFPEIHILQYPRNMGRPGVIKTDKNINKSTSSSSSSSSSFSSKALIPVQTDGKGHVKYDAIVTKGRNENKIVRTDLQSTKESLIVKESVTMPEDDEMKSTAERTWLALQAKLGNDNDQNTKNIKNMNSNDVDGKYIRYSADPDAPGYKKETAQRVIKMVEAQIDPMQPPRHKVKKVARGSGSPPVPILHSPSRKVTKEDQEAWKVPPVVSNWKNMRGFTVPLDKRLAADGRSLLDTTINNKFATLAEALYISERKAAEDLRIRNQLRKQLAMKEQEDAEAELRELASQARQQRGGALNSIAQYGDTDSDDNNDEERDPVSHIGRGRRSNVPAWMEKEQEEKLQQLQKEKEEEENEEEIGQEQETAGTIPVENDIEEVVDDGDEARAQRERIRLQRRKERERELRIEKMKGRKPKEDRDEGRDISEKIALGQHTGTGTMSGEAMYDSRLFNQNNSSGLSTGFGAEDDDNVYSKALFERNAVSSIYRPTSNEGKYGDAETQINKLKDTNRFKADKGFIGAGGASSSSSSSSGGGSSNKRSSSETVVRDGPVQFERATDIEEDPFGINDVIQTSRKKSRKE